MAKILNPEQFRRCPRGTVFAFGPRWSFGSMLVLDEIVKPFSNGGWGFYATDPMWVKSDDLSEAVETLEGMEAFGESAPIETASTKYMSYDGDKMEVFLVLESTDWDAITSMADFSAAAGPHR